MGELLGLTWSCVDISQDSIDHDCAYIYIDKELQRISRESLAQIGEKGIMFKFPTMRGCNSTVLALKEPKTKTSVRKVFLPRAVAEMLVERRKTIEELKNCWGMNIEIMTLYSPVPRGPLPKQITSTGPLTNSSRKIISPKWYFIVSGTPARPTNLNSAVADIKAVQGDTGHAQATMVMERYAHILDDDRRVNAARFQKEFYGGGSTAETAAVTESPWNSSPRHQTRFKTLTQQPNSSCFSNSLQNPRIWRRF